MAKKDRFVTFRANEEDYQRWKAEARSLGLSLTERITHLMNRKRLRDVRFQVSVSPKELRELKQEAARTKLMQEEREQEHDREIAERKRRDGARELSKLAGGVDAWFAGMNRAEREKWADLRDYLLQCEQVDREQAEWFRRNQARTEDRDTRPMRKITDDERSIIELPNGIIL